MGFFRGPADTGAVLSFVLSGEPLDGLAPVFRPALLKNPCQATGGRSKKHASRENTAG